MSNILYERPLTGGPVVRVRRTTAAGATPVHVVLEVDRRGGQHRDDGESGTPPALLEAEGPTESEALGRLLHLAIEDAEVAKLMRDKGLR
jgi:hypothetical protein